MKAMELKATEILQNFSNLEKSEKSSQETKLESSCSSNINNAGRKSLEEFKFDNFQFKTNRKTLPPKTTNPVLEQATYILECPFCGRRSQTEQARKRHLKECAKKRGITTAKMREAIELQKKQAEERRLAGFPMVAPRPARGSKPSQAFKRVLEPQTELQADMQMALAMSLSLEQEKKNVEDEQLFYLEALTVKDETKEHRLLKALGNGVPPEELQDMPARKRKNRKKEITPFWIVKSHEEMKRIHAERVEKILSEQLEDCDDEEWPFILNWKKVRALCTVPWPRSGSCRLIDVSGLSEKVRSNLQNFYVKSLKHWFRPKKIPHLGHIREENLVQVKNTGRRSEEVECLPSTSAALDALQACNTSFSQSDEVMDVTDAGLDGFFLDKTYGDGFFTQAEKQEVPTFNEQMTEQLLSMVDNDALSDVEIIVVNGEVIPCHRFILYARCPIAYKELGENISGTGNFKLRWSDVSREAAIAFLKFVYGGTFSDPGSCKKEVIRLAKRYQMRSLLDFFGSEGSDGELQECVKPNKGTLSLKCSNGRESSPGTVDSETSSKNLSPVDLPSTELSGSSGTSSTAQRKYSGASSPILTNECGANKIAKNLNQALVALSPPSSPELVVCSPQSNSRKPNSIYPNSDSIMSPELFDWKPSQDLTQCTTSSTPVGNRKLLSLKRRNTCGVSPLKLEKELSCNRDHGVAVKIPHGDSPEYISQQDDAASPIGSGRKICSEEESWERFKYVSDDDDDEEEEANIENQSLDLQTDSLVLELSSSDETDYFEAPKSEKRKIDDVSVSSSPLKKARKVCSTSSPRIYASPQRVPTPKSSAMGSNTREADNWSEEFLPDLDEPSHHGELPGISKSKFGESSAADCNDTWNNFQEGCYGDDDFRLSGDERLSDPECRREFNFGEKDYPKCTSTLPSSYPQGAGSSDLHVSRERSTKAVKSDKFKAIGGGVQGRNSIAFAEKCLDERNLGLPQFEENGLSPLNATMLMEEESDVGSSEAEVSPAAMPSKNSPFKRKKPERKTTKKPKCVTPMPHYSIMETPVIKKELKKIGVRALPKKKGVTLLKHVYVETHPEPTQDMAIASDKLLQKPSSPVIVPSQSSSGSSKEDFCISTPRKSKLSSKRLTKVPVLKEPSVSQVKTQLAEKGTSKTKVPLRIEDLQNFLKGNEELNTRILSYQPIDLKLLHSELKANGLKPTSIELKDLLDEQCITYTSTDEASPRKSKKPKRKMLKS